MDSKVDIDNENNLQPFIFYYNIIYFPVINLVVTVPFSFHFLSIFIPFLLHFLFDSVMEWWNATYRHIFVFTIHHEKKKYGAISGAIFLNNMYCQLGQQFYFVNATLCHIASQLTIFFVVPGGQC